MPDTTFTTGSLGSKAFQDLDFESVEFSLSRFLAFAMPRSDESETTAKDSTSDSLSSMSIGCRCSCCHAVAELDDKVRAMRESHKQSTGDIELWTSDNRSQ